MSDPTLADQLRRIGPDLHGHYKDLVFDAADRIAELEAENKRLRKAVWPIGPIGRT